MSPSMNGPERSGQSLLWRAEAAEAALARVLETGGHCGAELWLRNRKSGEWYRWEICNDDPGHEGRHSVWSERYMDHWCYWTDEGETEFVYNEDMAEVEKRFAPSPWSSEDIATVKAVRE